MRICIVTENHPLVLMGGAEYQTHLLAEELAKRPGVDVHYLARRTPDVPLAAHLPYAVRSIGNALGFRRRAVFFDLRALSLALAELRPDAIYAQMRQSYAAVCARYARKAGIPFFLHMASEWDVASSVFPHRVSANLPFDAVESLLGMWGLRRASHVIVQTDAQELKLRERFGIQSALLVRNFQPMPSAIDERPRGPIRVLWVGNIKAVKRPELYVEIARAFVHRTDIHFDMVGRPWRHRSTETLMREIQSLPNLTFHGELPIGRVNDLMKRATLYVNTSAHEGFPNTFIQAWANGAVLLSICVDPLNGMERIGVGYVTGTLDRMKSTIAELVGQPQRVKGIALKGFKFALENHSLREGEKLADAILGAADEYRAARSAVDP